MENIKITNPCKMWWAGRKEIEPYMVPVAEDLDNHFGENHPYDNERVQLYNRAYEDVHKIIEYKDAINNIELIITSPVMSDKEKLGRIHNILIKNRLMELDKFKVTDEEK